MVTRSILHRLDRLEEKVAGKGRGLVIVLDNAKSQDEIEALLSQQNIQPDDNSNQVVVLKRFALDENGDVGIAGQQGRFVSATPMVGTSR